MTKILIIDDDETILGVFNRFLTAKGYEVVVATDGKKGLRAIEKDAFNLVITDIMMPETDGLEVVMAIKARATGIPIIAMSGGMHAMPMDFLPMAKKFGACEVLYKPIELEDLLASVEKALA